MNYVGFISMKYPKYESPLRQQADWWLPGEVGPSPTKRRVRNNFLCEWGFLRGDNNNALEFDRRGFTML